MRPWRYSALVAGTLALCLTNACNRDQKLAAGGFGSSGDRGPAAVPDTASDPGAQVARHIVKAATLAEAVTATREALTRGGVPVTDLSQGTQPGGGSPSLFVVLPPEAVLLAFEARQHATHSRLTLDELGAMLADFGWPFAGEGMPGEQLMQLVAAWMRAAHATPDDPLNFTALFLADMGRRQIPAVDLASDSTDPGDVRLGFLEVQLFAAALTRGLGAPVNTGRLDRTPVLTASYGGTLGSGPCDDAKDWFGKTLPGGAVGAFGGWGVGQALEKALEAAGLSKARVGELTKALDAVATGMKIVKLGQLYGSTTIDLDFASDVPAHRPAPKEEKFASVVARAGIDPQELKEYQESLKSSELASSVRNCLETLGLPTWSDLADVASEAGSWRVKWVLGKGSPKHAVHIVDRNAWYVPGNRIMSLKRASATSAEAKYTFKLTPEIESGHPGDELRGEVQVTAELQTAKPPGVGTVSDAMLGVMGLVKALVDLGLGWFQTVVTPKASLIVPIRYHEPGINILIEDELQAKFDVSDFSDHLSKNVLGVSERSRHVYAGTIQLGQDSVWRGQVVLTATGNYARWQRLGVDVPSCTGSYDGAQIFTVEGSFTTGDKGQDQVELAFIPAGPPEFYNETPGCSYDPDGSYDEQIDGVNVIPTRLARGQEAAVIIDPPKAGEQRVYRNDVNLGKDIQGSTVITIGAKF